MARDLEVPDGRRERWFIGLRAAPLPGMRFDLVRFPVVSLVPS